MEPTTAEITPEEYKKLVDEYEDAEYQYNHNQYDNTYTVEHAEYEAELKRRIAEGKALLETGKDPSFAAYRACKGVLNYLFKHRPGFIEHRDAHNRYLSNKMVHLLLKIRYAEATQGIRKPLKTTAFPSYSNITYFLNKGVVEQEPVAPTKPLTEDERARYERLKYDLKQSTDRRNRYQYAEIQAMEREAYAHQLQYQRDVLLTTPDENTERDLVKLLFRNRPTLMSDLATKRRLANNDMAEYMLKIRQMECNHKMEFAKLGDLPPDPYLVDIEKLSWD